MIRKLHTGSPFIPPARPDELGDDPERDDLLYLIEPVYEDFTDVSNRALLDVTAVRADLAVLKKAAEEDVLNDLTRKYQRLLIGSSPPTLNPITLEASTEIFRFAWIEPLDRGPTIPYAATPEVVKKMIEVCGQTSVRKSAIGSTSWRHSNRLG